MGRTCRTSEEEEKKEAEPEPETGRNDVLKSFWLIICIFLYNDSFKNNNKKHN